MVMSAAGYLLETPLYPALLVQTAPDSGGAELSSKIVSGADNQQERSGIEQWIVGFVDGEGCFSCPVQRNREMTLGWQIQPRFAVVQGERSAEALEVLVEYFRCGKIYRNRRHDNHKEDLLVYSVFRLHDLRTKIVPFFEAHPLITAKREDFEKFREVLHMMDRRMHLTQDGLRRIAEITETMNHRKRSLFLESSEAIRQPTLLDGGVEDMVPPSWRHGEAAERNSLSGKFRPARMA